MREGSGNIQPVECMGILGKGMLGKGMGWWTGRHVRDMEKEQVRRARG